MMENGNREQSAVLRRVAWRVNLAAFLTRAAAPVAGVIIAFGIAYLLAQMLSPAISRYTFLILGALPVVLGWSYLRCKSAGVFFQEKDLVELADHLSVSDGRVATAYERPALAEGESGTAWEAARQHLQLRALRLNPIWFAWRLLPAALFAAAVFFVPPRQPKEPANTMMTTLTQPLAEKIKLAAEVLPEAEREKLEKQLEQVAQGPEAVSREKWEAVEDMQQRLENAMAQSVSSTHQLSSSMNQLAAMVAKQESQAPNINNAELQTDINTMAANINDQLAKNKAPMSKDMQERLKKAMSQCKNGQCNSNELSKLLKECQGMCDKMGKKEGGLPKYAGRGGRDRGRGDAELLFGEEITLDGAKFDGKQLENQFFDQADLTDIGITTLEPKPDPGKFAPGTVINYGSQQGTNVSRTEISPSQKATVERYFK